MSWQYTQPTGPKIYPGWKPAPDAVFPYLPDERSEDEIQQDKFDVWQRQYEYEQEHNHSQTITE